MKRLELLTQVVPGIKRVSCLSTKWIWDGPFGQELQRSAKNLGVAVEFAELLASDVRMSFRRVVAQRPDALFLVLSPEVYNLRQQLADLALENELALSAPFAEAADLGSLMSYGWDVPSVYRAAAHYLDKIFKGAKPGDLPVQQPSKFEFVINLKTAKAPGLKIPQPVLLRADRVIE